MGPLEHLDILTERTLQLAVVAERLDERSEAAVQATERAAQDMLAYCAPGATKKKRPPAERPEPVPQRSAE